MDCAYGPAVYSSDVGHRTYDVAGLWRAVLDSVGRYLLPLVADNGVCKVYASEKDMSKVWCSTECMRRGRFVIVAMPLRVKGGHVAVMIVSLRKLPNVEEPLSVMVQRRGRQSP